MTETRHHYGWKPSPPDHRDFRFAPPRRVLESLATRADLTAGMGPVLDQGSIGSCGPNSCDSLVMYDQGKEGLPVASYSRLFTYYATRKIMGTIAQDSGVENRSMLKALNQVGFCPEDLWGYDVFRFTEEPPPAAWAAALPNRVQSYAAVAQDAQSMKGCLASGLPFLFGFTVYESFESAEVARTGVVPMPSAREGVLGGHDVCIVGYDDETQRFKFKNSWGDGWGQKGYGYFPYAYCLDPNLADDFWVINAVPGGAPAPGPNPGPSPQPPAPAKLFSLRFSRAVPRGAPIDFRAPVQIPAGPYDVVPSAASAALVEARGPDEGEEGP